MAIFLPFGTTLSHSGIMASRCFVFSCFTRFPHSIQAFIHFRLIFGLLRIEIWNTLDLAGVCFFFFIYKHSFSKSFYPNRGHPRAFREGEVLRQFQDFRENFWSKFRISLYILYIFTFPSAQDREKSASLGRLFLPNRPLG